MNKTISDLRKTRDPVVYAFLQAWEHGEFPTLEAALIAMACGLVNNKEALAMKLLDCLQRSTPTPPQEYPHHVE